MDAIQGGTRSTFVTTVAWIFIVLGGFATLIGILQNVMIAILAPDFGPPPGAGAPEGMPPFFTLFAEHFRLFFAAVLVLSAATFVSSVGLLKRRNWARLLFIALMILAIVWNLAGVVLSYHMVSSMEVPPGAPADFGAQQETVAIVMLWFTAIVALSLSALFGWVIARLLSPGIRGEFGA